MPKILFYAPFNQRSRDTESLMLAFLQQGHTVMCLSQDKGYQINDFLNAHGVTATSHLVQGRQGGVWFYVQHLIYFIRYCYRHQIDIVYSHLEPANFVAAVGQYVIRARVFICRHHIDEGLLYRFDKGFFYRLTYRLARRIIVVSGQAKRYMVEQEHIPVEKIVHINLAYDFSLYPAPEKLQVERIRSEYAAEVLLVAACRLTHYKRPELAIRVVKTLSDAGLDVKLVLLGRGELRDSLLELIRELDLQDKVFLPGYVENVLDYLAAADFFLHPSLLDSSCVTIKEAGLVTLPVIVCKGVGDFDDYLISGQNAFLVESDHFVEASSSLIKEYYRNGAYLSTMGNNLQKSVLQHFGVDQVVTQYDTLNLKIR